MAAIPKHSIIVTWAPELRTDGWYVIEHLGQGYNQAAYGPMPLDMVQPLIAERQACVQSIMDRFKADMMLTAAE